MNDINFLKIYLRKTNGSGQLILLNPHLSTRLLHHYTSQLFNLPQKTFNLISKNTKIQDSSDITLEILKLQSGSIIHIQQINQSNKNNQQQNKTDISLRLFCQGSLYMYKAQKNSTVRDLKYQVTNMFGCFYRDILIVYLGRIIDDNDTLLKSQIKNNDLLSVVITPSYVDKRSSTKLKPKIAESMTFAASQQADSNYQPFAYEVMRKSSMKSSQEQSRQFRKGKQKPSLKTIRPKSSLTRSNNSLDLQIQIQKQQQKQKKQQINNFAWLTNQKVIETQSINFDDPQQEQIIIQKWNQCKIQLSNKQKTMFYTLECSQSHDVHLIINLLKRLQNHNIQDKQLRYNLIFSNQVQQQMADQGKKILEIAKANKIQIIHQVIFQTIQA